MTDSYLSIAAIANNQSMYERVMACATQQTYDLDTPSISNPINWVGDNRYLWASTPGWGTKWAQALEAHSDDPDYDPGKELDVITDSDILAVVQAHSN